MYVDVLDDDNNRDDLIDIFVVDLKPTDLVAGAVTIPRDMISGRLGIATIELSFQLECLPGFSGGECTPVCDSAPCSNSGSCEPNVTSAGGFTCTCVGDFTGQTCDVMIDDCLSVSCNSGSCVDGVWSFTCECEVGYTGQFCEQQVGRDVTTPTDSEEGRDVTTPTDLKGGRDVTTPTDSEVGRDVTTPTDTPTNTMDNTDGITRTADHTDRVLVPVLGGVVGGIVLILVLVVTLILVVLKLLGAKQSKTQEGA